MNTLKIKKVRKYAMLPERMTNGSAGMDLYPAILEPIVIPAHDTVIIPTGIAVEVPKGYEVQIRSRSGLAAKYKVFVLNSPGTIDSDYRGEIKVILYNLGEESYTVHPMDRIAQAVISEVPAFYIKEVTELTDTDRAEGGFGSTGQ